MRRFTKYMTAVFCVGVLLGGIGCGIAFVEYSSLEYTGRTIIGEEYVKEASFDYAVEPVEGKKLIVSSWHGIDNVVFDDSIPENTVRWVVTYNEKIVEPSLYYEKLTDDEYIGSACIRYYYMNGEFDLFMQNKDKILEDLKNNRFGSYEASNDMSVDIMINPGLEGFVEVVY